MNIRILLLALVCLPFGSCSSKEPDNPNKGSQHEVGELQIEVGGSPVTVYDARVSKYPQNETYKGFQRPTSQTEIAHFAYFDYEDNSTVKITTKGKINEVLVRPQEYGIKPTVNGNTVELKLTKPCQIVVEFNGTHHEALHLFANPKELSVAKPENARYYYGPGEHEAGEIQLRSGETMYIDEGAVVYGIVKSDNANNIKIIGKGILDGSRAGKGPIIAFNRCSNALVEGIIVRDPTGWAIVPTLCNNVTYDNVKCVGFWRYNSDGIDICNSRNINVKNCFIRAFDDCIAMKGQQYVYNEGKVMNTIRIDNCVLWNDWGKAVEFGAETVVDVIRDVKVTNCFIPHFTFTALSMQNGDRGRIEDVHFENISIEEVIKERATLEGEAMNTLGWGRTIDLGVYGTSWSSDKVRGSIKNVTFTNIRCLGPNHTGVSLGGYDSSHMVSDIKIKDYYINGTKITGMSQINTNEFVKNVTVE